MKLEEGPKMSLHSCTLLILTLPLEKTKGAFPYLLSSHKTRNSYRDNSFLGSCSKPESGAVQIQEGFFFLSMLIIAHQGCYWNGSKSL